MSFWSSLGKIASIAGPIAAIPFTGGTSALALGASGAATGAGTLSKILGAAAGAAPVLSGIAGGRAAGKAQDIQNQFQNQQAQSQADRLNLERTRLQNEALQSEFQNKLGLNQIAAERPNLRASQAVRGDILANVKDFQFTGPIAGGRVHLTPSTGGLRPSAVLGPNARLAGQKLGAIGSSMLGREDLPAAPAPSQYGPISPVGSVPGGSNFADKLFGGAAGASALLGAFQKKPVVPTRPPTNLGGVDPYMLPGWSQNPPLQSSLFARRYPSYNTFGG